MNLAILLLFKSKLFSLMFLRIYNPELFQGSLKKKRYFEGWYFKHVSNDLSRTISVIPGLSLTENDSHAFIQVLDGVSGSSEYFRYPVSEFCWEKKKLFLQIGSSTFTTEGINLNIRKDGISIKGQVTYSNRIGYPKKIYSPGIMGWYSFVPFMECFHGIVSVIHDLRGEITITDRTIDLNDGKGYIEKDWGTSFPEAWIWIQSNNFSLSGTSFSFSVAKIPWIGRFFIGFIAFLYLNKKFYIFSTYNKSVISEISHDQEFLDITLQNSHNILKIRVLRKSFGELRAPVQGEMSRVIHESVDSEVILELFDDKRGLIFRGIGKNAGLEIVEKIFEYL